MAMAMFRSFMQTMHGSSVATTPLGRWNLKCNHDVTSIFANSDHCGSVVCKDPRETKKQISLALFKSELKANKCNNTPRNTTCARRMAEGTLVPEGPNACVRYP